MTNAGTITGAGKIVVDPTTFTNIGYTNIQVDLDASGLSNTSTGTIKVAGTAVYGYGGASYVTNTGIVDGTGTSGVGVDFKSGGTITNGATNATGALIEGNTYGVEATGTAATVSNFGTVQVTGVGSGIFLQSGGNVTNIGSAAYIHGIAIFGQGSVSNAGSVFGGAEAISLGSGTVNNLAGGRLVGGTFGVEAVVGAATISNAGTIDGTGTAGMGVYLAAGSVANTGTAAYIGGGLYGVKFETVAGTVTNYGTVAGNRYGIFLLHGGSVTNSGTASLISGSLTGAAGDLAATTLSNAGTIVGSTGAGVEFAAGGSLSNSGLIKGGADGVFIDALGATVVNSGTISGTLGFGVEFLASGYVVNGSTSGTAALISGGTVGVNLAGTGTNFGTIEGTSVGV
ncbi:MAG TPA: hypothetical protein VM782_08670, partial [Stellaceae bacterium]|nr:hypothetical protein [Stellaceae bacterium]